MTTWAHPAMRQTLCGLAAGALFLWGGRELAAAPAPKSADVCVTMTGSSGQVAGLQMDLTWDPGCMTAERQEGSAASCASNPATRKNVQTNIFADNRTMRVLFLSVSDTNPISDDELFCCKFTMTGSQANPCCSLNIGNLIVAGPSGGQVSRIYDPNVSIQALVGGVPCMASIPGGSPDSPVRPPLPPVAIPAGPAPGVSAPGAAPIVPGREAPAQPAARQQAPLEAPAAPAQVPPSGEEAPAPELTVQPAATAAVFATPGSRTPAPGTPTPLRTAAAATPTPYARTPQPQSPAPAAVRSPTAGSAAQTPAPTVKKPEKKHSP